MLTRTPEVVVDDQDPTDESAVVVPPRYHGLLRLLLVSVASCPLDRSERTRGAPISVSVAASVLRGKRPDQEVPRAISVIRAALADAGSRPRVDSLSLRGGGAMRQPTDISFIETVNMSSTERAYVLVVEPEDNIDWLRCQHDVALAAQALGQGRIAEARHLAKRWETALAQTDLDTAFDDLDLHLWGPEERNAVRIARLKVIRILGLTAGREGLFTETIRCAELLRREDPGNEVYDGTLAQEAIRSVFAIERTRESSLAAYEAYVVAPDVPSTEAVRRFRADLNGVDGWPVARRRWLVEWEVDVAEDGGQRAAEGRPRLDRAPSGSALVLPDPLTPGFSVDALERVLGRQFEPEVRRALAETAELAVVSVERGDFVMQEEVGRRLIDLSDEVRHLQAAGHYFVGEGLRLQADLHQGRQRISMREAAIEAYETSRDLDPSSVRAVRGLARTFEVLGEPEEATKLFQLGYATGLQQLVDQERMEPDRRNELDHEILRITRHYAHCLTDLRTSEPGVFKTMVGSEDEIHRLASESGRLHRQKLPLFSSYKRWSLIETFMGLTLLAKSYVSVGDDLRASYELASAFVQRRSMLSPPEPLTPIELANFQWWLGVAMAVRGEPMEGWRIALDGLGEAMADPTQGFVVAALDRVERTVSLLLPPRTG